MEQLTYLAARVFGQLLRIAARSLCVLRLKFNVDKLRSQTFDLFLDGRTNIECRDDSTEAFCRCDRLQPGHSGAEYESRRRTDRAGGRHHQGHEFTEIRGCHQCRFVAGNA